MNVGLTTAPNICSLQQEPICPFPVTTGGNGLTGTTGLAENTGNTESIYTSATTGTTTITASTGMAATTGTTGRPRNTESTTETSNPGTNSKRIKMVMNDTITNFDQRLFANKLAAILAIPMQNIVILFVQPGSVMVTFLLYGTTSKSASEITGDLMRLGTHNPIWAANGMSVISIEEVGGNGGFTEPTETETTIQTSANENDDSDESSSGGTLGNEAIFGAIIGLGMLILICIAILAIFIVRRKRDVHTTANTNIQLMPMEEASLHYLKEIKFSDLKIENELGHGAFGVVYKATWKKSECVVKQMKSNALASTVDDFLKEAKQMKNIPPHPHVVTLYGVCLDPKFPMCIVTEYVPGGSLLMLLRSYTFKMTGEIAVRMSKDVALGMIHLHSENILHCDLAARNLLVYKDQEGNYRVKIADFGLSHTTPHDQDIYSTDARQKVPIRWAAPEVIAKGVLSKALVNVWSFGIVVWEITTGMTPYFELTNAQVAVQVNQGHRLPKPQECGTSYPMELYTQVMMSCWRKSPEERPTFEVLYDDIVNIEKTYSGKPIQTPTTPSVHTRDFSTYN